MTGDTGLLKTLALAASGGIDGGAVGGDVSGTDDGLLSRSVVGGNRRWRSKGVWQWGTGWTSDGGRPMSYPRVDMMVVRLLRRGGR